MATDIGGDEHPSLRHRFERLQRRDQVGEAHLAARIREHVDQFVIALDVAVRDAAGEYDAIAESACSDLRTQRRFLRAAADEQRAQVRQSRRSIAQRIDQQVEALVPVERPGEADARVLPSSPSAVRSSASGAAAEAECANVDGVGNDGDPVGGDAARR